MTHDAAAPGRRQLTFGTHRRDAPDSTFIAERQLRERAKSARLARDESRMLSRCRAPHRVIPLALAASGLAGRARRNALAIGLSRQTLVLPTLPRTFDGFRILHLSDMHFGADAALDTAIIDSVIGVAHDLCVMTGDYRYRSFGPIEKTLANMTRLVAALERGPDDLPPLAVLGNHDSAAMIAPFEALGLHVLLNECASITGDGGRLQVAGIDDPRYYRLDDIDAALAGRDPDDGPAATLLLAHSPERAEEAAAAGCDAYLCGHTHGGQLCLPGGRILMRNAHAPLQRLTGNWRVGEMRGYTSRGAGVSIATARLHCPPEVTLHTLAREPPR